MTCLDYSIEGQSVESIANYLSMEKAVVVIAISEGAKTYADVYNYGKSGPLKYEAEAPKEVNYGNKKFPKRKTYGKNFFNKGK